MCVRWEKKKIVLRKFQRKYLRGYSREIFRENDCEFVSFKCCLNEDGFLREELETLKGSALPAGNFTVQFLKTSDAF